MRRRAEGGELTVSEMNTSRAEKHATPRHWILLFSSSILEAVWALALDASESFSQLVPSIVFFVAMVLSMLGLATAMRGLPISVAYAVWTGTGAALTVTVSMLNGSEPVSILKIIFLAGIIGCVVGLKFAKDPKPAATLS